MRERVEQLGGTVRVDSAPGEGTRVLFRVPLPETVSQYLVGGGNLPLRLSGLPFLQAQAIVILAAGIVCLFRGSCKGVR
jgi:hypothetical protein